MKFENNTIKSLIELFKSLPEENKASQITILNAMGTLLKLSKK